MSYSPKTKINLLLLLAVASVFAAYGCGIAAFIYLFKSNISSFVAYIILAIIARQIGYYSLQGVRHYAVIFFEEVIASQVSVPNPNSESPESVQTVMKTEIEKREEASKSTTYTEDKNRNGWGKE